MASNIRPVNQPEPMSQPQEATPEPEPQVSDNDSQTTCEAELLTPEAQAWEEIDTSVYEPDITIDEMGDIVEGAPLGGEYLTPDQFYEGLFKAGLHDMPAMMLRLESLPIKPEEEDNARAASDALYDFCVEIPWLNFLIKPENITMQRMMVILAYAVPKMKAVKMELAGPKRSSAKPQQQKSEVKDGVV